VTEPTTLGIDPSVRHPSLGEWPSGRTWTLHTPGTGAARLGWIADSWEALLREIWTPKVNAVFIERARGKFVPVELVESIGVIQAVTWNTLLSLSEHPTSVFIVSTAEWKAGSVGRGHASKPEVLAWAKSHGYEGKIQDEADALGIACAGSRMLAAEQPSLL
jgi:Holliday junction resolvasome RuvABC endonuclease subunit